MAATRRTWAGMVMAGLASVLASGCLVKDVTHTWYVDDKGVITWVVHEKDVRSDAKADQDRRTEEAEYWLGVQQDRHSMVQAFRELGGISPRTTVLRATVPYSVQTEAKFAGLDVLGQRLIGAIGGTGASTIVRDGAAWTWTFVVRDPSAFGTMGEPTDAMTDLLADMEHLHVVLVNGQFESSEGFELSADRRVATLKTETPSSRDGDTNSPVVTLRLVWRGTER